MGVLSLFNQALSNPNTKASLVQAEVLEEFSSRREAINSFFNLPFEKKFDFIEQYSDELWVYILVNRIAQSSARVPLQVFKRKSQSNGTKGLTKSVYDLITKKYGIKLRPYDLRMECHFSTRSMRKFPLELLQKLDVVEDAGDSELAKLLDRPNPWMTKYYLMEGSLTYLELRGNAFIEMVGANPDQPISPNNPPIELWHHNPDNIVIIPDPKDYIGGYVYAKGTTKVPIPKENIIHVKYFNPTNQYYGQGTLEALSSTIRSEKSVVKFNQNFYKQGMKPSGLLKTNDKLADFQFNRLQKHIEANYGGLENMHRPLLLEGGLEWQAISVTQREAELIATKQMNREEYMAAFGVPPIMVGLPTENRAVSDNARKVYYLDTISPKLATHEEKFNNELTPLFGEEFFVKFDLSGTPAGEVDKEEFIKGLDFGFRSGLMTRDEGRLNLRKLNVELSDIDLGEGGSEFFQSTNLIPLGSVDEGADDLTEPEEDEDN